MFIEKPHLKIRNVVFLNPQKINVGILELTT